MLKEYLSTKKILRLIRVVLERLNNIPTTQSYSFLQHIKQRDTNKLDTKTTNFSVKDIELIYIISMPHCLGHMLIFTSQAYTFKCYGRSKSTSVLAYHFEPHNYAQIDYVKRQRLYMLLRYLQRETPFYTYR